MEVDIYYEYLRGGQHDIFIKEFSVAAKIFLHTFPFRNQYPVSPHGSEENGLNWDDGIVPYFLLETAVSETVARYTHLYYYGLQSTNFSLNYLSAPFSFWKTLVTPIVIN